MERQILHIDMNNCYASIEIKLRPELKGLPVVVSASDDNNHGIVLAKSQEAKLFGIVTAEPIWQARKKCKDLVIVKPHYSEYKKHSIWAREIYYSYTNQVEPFSLDEAWLDITGSTKLFGSPEKIAHTIRERIKKEMGITVSVGLSFNKVFAKLASDNAGPDSVAIIEKENFKSKVWPMKIDSMMGIGKSTAEKLNNNGIFTLGDLANTSKNDLIDILGIHGERIWIQANGLESTQVKDFNHLDPVKSVSHGKTFSDNLTEMEDIKFVFQYLSQKVSRRLIELNLEAMSIQISVKDSDFKTQSFQEALQYSTFSSIIIRDKALELFKNYKIKNPIRYLAVGATNLTKDTNVQTTLFTNMDQVEKKSNLDMALYNIQKNFGKDAIKLGTYDKDIITENFKDRLDDE